MITSRVRAQTTLEAPANGEKSTDKSGEFLFELPKGWEKRNIPQFKHDIIILPKIDNKNRTIVFTDQSGPGSLKDIASKYRRDLPKALKNFKLVSSKIVAFDEKNKAAKIVHTNSQPGIPVRQINYIIKINDKYYFIAYTGMETDGTKFDGAVQDFVASIGPAKK